MDLAVLFVTVLLGVGAIVATVAVAVHSRDQKSVDIAYISDIKLLTSDSTEATSSFSKRIELRYDDIALTFPRIVDLKFLNTGNKAIVAQDWDQPISITLPDGSPPIDAVVVDENPDGLIDSIFEESADGRRISIAPRLLNETYWFTVRVLVDSNAPGYPVRVSHRIIGGKPLRLHGVEREDRSTRAWLRIYGLGWIVGIPVGVYLGIRQHDWIFGVLTAVMIPTVLVIPGLILARLYYKLFLR